MKPARDAVPKIDPEPSRQPIVFLYSDAPRMTARAGVELVRAHLAAEDAQDLDVTMATFTQQCWYVIPSQDYFLRGQGAVRAHYEALFASIVVRRAAA